MEVQGEQSEAESVDSSSSSTSSSSAKTLRLKSCSAALAETQKDEEPAALLPDRQPDGDSYGECSPEPKGPGAEEVQPEGASPATVGAEQAEPTEGADQAEPQGADGEAQGPAAAGAEPKGSGAEELQPEEAELAGAEPKGSGAEEVQPVGAEQAEPKGSGAEEVQPEEAELAGAAQGAHAEAQGPAAQAASPARKKRKRQEEAGPAASGEPTATSPGGKRAKKSTGGKLSEAAKARAAQQNAKFQKKLADEKAKTAACKAKAADVAERFRKFRSKNAQDELTLKHQELQEKKSGMSVQEWKEAVAELRNQYEDQHGRRFAEVVQHRREQKKIEATKKVEVELDYWQVCKEYSLPAFEESTSAKVELLVASGALKKKKQSAQMLKRLEQLKANGGLVPEAAKSKYIALICQTEQSTEKSHASGWKMETALQGDSAADESQRQKVLGVSAGGLAAIHNKAKAKEEEQQKKQLEKQETMQRRKAELEKRSAAGSIQL